LGVSKMF